MAQKRGWPWKEMILKIGSSVSTVGTSSAGEHKNGEGRTSEMVQHIPLNLGPENGEKDRSSMQMKETTIIEGTKEEEEGADADPEGNETVTAETPWVSLFSNNQAASNGMKLSYIPPEIVEGNVTVKLDKKETERETDKWKNSLVIYILGETPGYNQMQRYIAQNWNKVAKPDLYYHEDGYYIARFANEKSLHEILYDGHTQ